MFRRNFLCDKKHKIILFILFLLIVSIKLLISRKKSSCDHVLLYDPIKPIDPILLKPRDYRILLLYVWANTTAQSFGNLEFFIRHGLHESQPIDCYFILQKLNNQHIDESTLPKLPSNAHYIQHDNECYDIGTFGWFFNQNIVQLARYKYFIFMNSSIRGPFLIPALMDVGLWWFDHFTRRITNEIKLVGSTVNCQISPHVQSYILVTDQTGFLILKDRNTTVFECHRGYQEAVYNGEVAASKAIISANYNIASVQMKYQNIDFRRRENQNCNEGKNPITREVSIDGINHDPYELIFIKFKSDLPSNTEYENRAQIYQTWLEQKCHYQSQV